MKVKIKNLRLRAIIGINDWEKKEKQDIIINIVFEYNAEPAAQNDDINHAVNYKEVKKNVINLVNSSKYNLIETLADKIADLVLENKKIENVSVEIDKPHALRFADSVSVISEKSNE